ncbi:MAG: Cytochrome c oxidase subunit [Verrucomicrobiales bacterium]|nr:Cytochrome c oxidase subunit [Verrucomicrobiales bacterium]
MTSVSANPTDASAVKYSSADIDASCRGPVLFLFFSATLWLILGSLVALVASIKLHAPAMLAECPLLTYGRLQAAQTDIFLYGFASEVAIGLVLWLTCQLGRVRLVNASAATIGAVFWNLALAIGIVGILAGDSTGFDWFEVPRYAAPLFVVAFILIGIVAVATYHARVKRTTYVSQWFLMAALFILPWTLTTANLLLLIHPVRGVMQSVVDYWFIGNFLFLWLASVAIATVFYFIPKISGQPLHSYYLALFAFWTFIFFGGWCGIPAGVPLPSWLPAVSAAARLLLLIPILALVVNWRLTLANNSVKGNITLRFMVFAMISLLIAGLLTAGNSLPLVNDVTEFTIFTGAISNLWLYGFIAMAFFGAIYYIAPRLTLMEWPRPALANMHYWLVAIGLIILVVALGLGGVKQGQSMNAGGSGFLVALKFLRPSTLGLLLIAIGNLALLMNLGCMLRATCRKCCQCSDKGGKR